MAIDKPAGLLVHRTGLDAGETRFAVQLLREQIGRPVWPVHRLDKGTSGVLLFALDFSLGLEVHRMLKIASRRGHRISNVINSVFQCPSRGLHSHH